MTCSQGARSKLLVDSALPFDGSSEAYDYLYESMQKHGRIVAARGITGSRSNTVERTRVAPYSVDGKIALNCCALDWDRWLPRILGAAEVPTNSFTLAETLPIFYVLLDKVGDVYRYDDCYVNSCLISAEADPEGDKSMLVMVLDIMAKNELDTVALAAIGVDPAWPSTAPAIPTTANRAIYTHYEGTLTIGGTAYAFKDFALMIHNKLERRWVNSLTATEICATDRYVALRTNHAFTTTEKAAFMSSAVQATAAGGVASSLAFSTASGAYSTTFTMAGLQWQGETPTVPGKQEIECPMLFTARMKGTSRELVVTNDSHA